MERDFKTNETLKQKIELCRANLALLLLSKIENADAHVIHSYDRMIDWRTTLKVREDAFTNATRGMDAKDKEEIRMLLDDLNVAIEDYKS